METNLNKIRSETMKFAKSIPIATNKFGLVDHPFTVTSNTIIPNENNTNELYTLDLTNKNDVVKWFKFLEKEINKMNLLSIYDFVSDKYKLTWLKFCKNYLSSKDFAEYFADVWISAENPNGDPNVPISTLISWFKEYPNEHLMVENDLEHFKKIPDSLILYRGVGKNRNPYGLSYTASKEKAEWFQNRYSKDECFMISLNVKKEDILVYFNTRNEDEYIVDIEKYKNEINKQIPF